MERDTPITVAPAVRNNSVTNEPSPPLAPVTTTILPSSDFMFGSSFSRRPRHAKFGIQRETAAREDRLAGDVRSFIRGQERKDRGDFVRGRRVSDGDVAFDFTTGLRI